MSTRSARLREQFSERMFTRDQFYELIGHKETLDLEKHLRRRSPQNVRPREDTSSQSSLHDKACIF